MNLEQLYKDYSAMVFNLALQYVQNYEDAQEITQDVFLSVHQGLKKFKGASAVSTWIYRITINKSLDFIKARKAKKRFAFITSLFGGEKDELIHDPPEFNHPGVQLEQKEETERVFKWLNELPPNQKTALILSKIDQKSQKEVAEIMQISPKAVESLVQRAKVNMAEKMKRSEG